MVWATAHLVQAPKPSLCVPDLTDFAGKTIDHRAIEKRCLK